MIKNTLMVLIFAVLGALSVGWWVNHAAIVDKQEADLQKFISVGPRFTAKDGQELCERVAFLERQSIGWRKSGTIQKPCLYYQKP